MGFFVGDVGNHAYVDGQRIWYDDVDSLTWSPLMVEKIVEEIGYEMACRIKIWYCIPMLSIRKNGLREIRDEYDTQTMVSLVDIGYHCFSLYVDHDECIIFKGSDDVVLNPAAALTTVISPVKTSCNRQHAHEEHPVEEQNVELVGTRRQSTRKRRNTELAT